MIASLQWLKIVQPYDLTTGIAKKFGGTYGLGIIYAKAVLGEHASEAGLAAE